MFNFHLSRLPLTVLPTQEEIQVKDDRRLRATEPHLYTRKLFHTDVTILSLPTYLSTSVGYTSDESKDGQVTGYQDPCDVRRLVVVDTFQR